MKNAHLFKRGLQGTKLLRNVIGWTSIPLYILVVLTSLPVITHEGVAGKLIVSTVVVIIINLSAELMIALFKHIVGD